jgi:hypothetical protein
MAANTIQSLRIYFPNLNPETDRITSPATDAYNCVAWAHYDTERWWQRESWHPTFWPEELADDFQPVSWINLFKLSGYAVCSGG